jgi:itaconyl-CoA hydratase
MGFALRSVKVRLTLYSTRARVTTRWNGDRMDERNQAPKEWRGRYFEDIETGDIFRSRLGRTITDSDNVWFTCLTMNTNQVHFNVPFAEQTRFGQPLVNSCFTLALVTGLSVPDTSENATANLAWSDISLPRPVFVGDTLWSESEILDIRESKSNPSVGIVSMRTRGINQNGEVVIEFLRTFMIYRRDAPEARPVFPITTMEWSVGRT